MKIAFVGKGGSGKTTLAALFAQHLERQNLPVLCLDADINQHLARALDFASPPIPALGLEIQRIKEYVRGTNPRIGSAQEVIKTTPPGTGSRLLRLTADNPIFNYFAARRGSLKLMAAGPMDESELGVKCYHSKIGAVELILSHLLEGPNEYVIVDMTAGADSFASGLFTKFDLTILVVEPTLKSVEVFRQYRRYCEGWNLCVKAVANKIEGPDDLAFLREHLQDSLIATFTKSNYVKSLEKGARPDIAGLEPANFRALAAIQQTLDTQPQDWDKFYRYSAEFHIKNALAWANHDLGRDLTTQVDPTFKFQRYL